MKPVTTELIKKLALSLEECSEDLAGEVVARYGDSKDHPAMARKFKRDLEPVHAARDLLYSLPEDIWQRKQ